MKLLLDENLPVKLKHRFKDKGIEAFTVREMEWHQLKNGALLTKMLENDFDTLITIDNNLSFQQNFTAYPIKVIVIVAMDNTYNTIMEIFDKVLEVLDIEQTGGVAVIHPKHKKFNP